MVFTVIVPQGYVGIGTAFNEAVSSGLPKLQTQLDGLLDDLEAAQQNKDACKSADLMSDLDKLSSEIESGKRDIERQMRQAFANGKLPVMIKDGDTIGYADCCQDWNVPENELFGALEDRPKSIGGIVSLISFPKIYADPDTGDAMFAFFLEKPQWQAWLQSQIEPKAIEQFNNSQVTLDESTIEVLIEREVGTGRPFNQKDAIQFIKAIDPQVHRNTICDALKKVTGREGRGRPSK